MKFFCIFKLLLVNRVLTFLKICQGCSFNFTRFLFNLNFSLFSNRNQRVIKFISSNLHGTQFLNISLPLSLKRYSSQVVHCWPECWKKQTTFSDFSPTYCSSKLTIFLLVRCWHFVSSVLGQKINCWKVGLSYLEKQPIYTSDPFLCFDITAVNTSW